jgi:hypothetical protein
MGMKRNIAAWFFVSLLAAVTVRAGSLGIMVPAYFTPGTKWDAMDYAASRIPLIAIMNANNGPGSSKNASYVTALANLHAAGGKVTGYIYTSYAARPIADVEADIDTYLAWYDVDGFFVDEMTNDSDTNHLAYYAELYQYIKSKGARYSVTGNPGSNTQEAYLSTPTADCLMNFENSSNNYVNFTPSSWVQKYPATDFVHLPYGVGGTTALTNFVNLAISRNAGWIYISDLTIYSALPTYWTNEVNLVQTLNNLPAIDPTKPADQSARIGDAATFTVTASSASPLFYQWFFNGNAVRDATNATYNISSVQFTNAGSYYAQVGNSNGTVSSRTATLSIKAGTYKHISIDGNFSDWVGVPLAATKPQVIGDVISFENLYVANDEDYIYIRFSLYSAANPFTSQQNIFFDVDTNAATGYSENGLGSEMLVQSGAGYRETNGVFNSSPITGVNWLAAPAVPASEYEVRISRHSVYTNNAPVFTNNTVTLFLETGENSGNKWFPDVVGGLLYTFVDPPTPIVFTDTNQPADQYVVQGRPVTLNVLASGSALVQYQWYQGSNPIQDATNASYSIAAVNFTNGGTYYAQVSNPVGPTNSRVATVTVLADTIAPSVTNISATARQVTITFSEPLDGNSATNPANYTLSGGGSFTNAVLNGQTVTLYTASPLTLGTVYTISINGVKDLFGNAAHTSASIAPTIIITIDGDMSDWAGIPPVYDNPTPGVDGAADFKDIYVYNDANYYYFRVTLWHDIPSANGFFPKYVNMFYDTDNNSGTGYSAIGSEFLQQSSSFYQERGGGFNEGQVLVNMAAGYLIAPTVRETTFPADFEFRYPRNAQFSAASGGGLVFSTNVVNFLWQGQTPGFVVENTASINGGVISYTNTVATVVPAPPLGGLAISTVPGHNVAVTWDTPATLQSVDSLNNTWTNVSAAAAPYITPAANSQFFRLSK